MLLRPLSVRVNGVVEESIVDGPGLRYVVFTQGCPHACKGCHNQETHCMQGGYLVQVRTLLAQFKENPLLAGITISGGEPFLQPAPLAELARAVKQLGKSVVVYSGFTFEQLLVKAQTNLHTKKLLGLCDLLIDGPYIEELKDLQLQFKGSSNQRVLDKQDRDELLAAFVARKTRKAQDCFESEVFCLAPENLEQCA